MQLHRIDSARVESADARRLFARYRRLDDERWLSVLATPLGDDPADRRWLRRLLRRSKVDSDLPSFPAPELQEAFVGTSDRQTLAEAFNFYRSIKRRCRELGRPISPEWRILDFGCGWGRMIRFYLKDVPAENLYGIDVDAAAIEICRRSMPGVCFEVVEPLPPSALAEGSFDLVFAYSVFSHLAEDAQLQWVREIARLLAPGGLLFATTQKRSFLEYCNSLTPEQATTVWLKSLIRSFRPLEEHLARYDRGEFLYSPTGGGGVRESSFYGEAVIPESYAARTWSPMLRLLAFDQESLPQALIVAEKPK